MKSSVFIFGSGRFSMVLALICALSVLPGYVFAAQQTSLVVTPLQDDSGHGTQPGAAVEGTITDEQGAAAGSDGVIRPELPTPPSYKDGIVMAYLVELIRKQDKPCPSGTKPLPPPSLLFSEPLCRVAESVRNGVEFPDAYAEQGIYASHWRMFSAGDLPAQQVATRLRAEHCEALHEPYTHIGAWRGSEGWRIVLATLTQKPETNPGIVPVAAVEGDPKIGSNFVSDAAADPPSQAVSVPPEAPISDIAPWLAAPASVSIPALDASGREERDLFHILNDIRVNGGSCIGQPARTAPPLTFNAQLQASAGKAAGEAASRGGFENMSTLAAKENIGAKDYPALKIAKLVAVSRSSASVVADTWMVNPSRCGMLLSADFEDVGVGFSDGYWVVLMGERAKGVPSPEVPASRQSGADH